MFYFKELLERLGMSPERVRLLRHDVRGLLAWQRGGEATFGCYASFQSRPKSPYGRDVATAFHFLPGPTVVGREATALLVGATHILERWEWDGKRLPRLFDERIIASEHGKAGLEAFDLEWLPEVRPYSHRVLIEWGAGTKAWSQWATTGSKQILELRLEAQERVFPGFVDFCEKVSAIPTLPLTWAAALKSVQGVYLLVAPNGEQYVGSATGENGLYGRWLSYAADGHGGNVLLRQRGHSDYEVSILELASPQMSSDDVLAREAWWKKKLGSRAFGLNRN